MANPLLQINDVVREMTKDELTAYKADQKAITAQQIEVDAKAAARASALAKLADLGLTAEEIAVL